MNTIVIVAIAVVLGLVILSKIPGLEHAVRPAIGLIFAGLSALLENLWSWSIWLFKVMWSAHWELLRNLLLPAEAIDPSVEVREAAEAGG